jgi:hypothetical protein
MSSWTRWRKIADHYDWFDDELDWDGPACYELSIAGPRGGDRLIVYVGETSNEQRRVITYASTGSHLAKIIASHLKDGWHLYYRAQSKETKQQAVQMQNRLLAEYEYDWNILLNR